jgi:hypothetical protein
VVVGADHPATINVDNISEHLQARLRVKPSITIQDRGMVQAAMEQAEGRKLKRFFDFRGE